jgi:hypothetical protein
MGELVVPPVAVGVTSVRATGSAESSDPHAEISAQAPWAATIISRRFIDPFQCHGLGFHGLVVQAEVVAATADGIACGFSISVGVRTMSAQTKYWLFREQFKVFKHHFEDFTQAMR